MAIERILDNAEESAAPIVPDESANAAADSAIQLVSYDGELPAHDSVLPELLRPRLGPEIYERCQQPSPSHVHGLSLTRRSMFSW